jgi:hypothetical protein
MYSLLLKKALPFALTLVLGSFIGGLFKSFGPGDYNAKHARAYGYGEGRSCPMHARGRYLVAESKPLKITFQPDADGKLMSQEPYRYVRVSVTFGADGKVQKVEQLQPLLPNVVLKAAERAAWQIQFEPETDNGVPVTVTREVEIRFGTVYG